MVPVRPRSTAKRSSHVLAVTRWRLKTGCRPAAGWKRACTSSVVDLTLFSIKTKPEVPPGIHSIRNVMGCSHLLVEDNGRSAVLLDAGFFGEMGRLRRLLHRLDLGPHDIEAILLTHGHLDHVGNLVALREWTGAPVYAHEEERAHVEARYPYTGWSRVCGWLEKAGRILLRRRIGSVDRTFTDGEVLPFWGGLRVIHLPGHTRGHCGFYSERHDLLFSGDLFASYFFNTHEPPAILNSVPDEFPASFRRVQEINPRLVVPNHYDWLDPVRLRGRLDRLVARRFPASASLAG